MSDKVAFHESSSHPAEAEAQRVEPASDGTEGTTQLTDPAEPLPTADAPPPEPPLYGPAPGPVKRPLIFDQVYSADGTDMGDELKSASPSFSISVQPMSPRSVNTPLSRPSSGAQPTSALGGEEQQSPSAAEPDSVWDETTISVESQSSAPTLNEIGEIDVSEATREELMVYHSELMGWIRELEQALENCQADFKSHLHQYRSQEQLLEQRTEEVASLQVLSATLNREIDTQQKAHQRQGILLETLQAQLDSSQERVAQMERDFSQVQRRCSDQAQQLLQAEGLCRDLKSRLSRQQRHTLQFKSALEKSLAVSVSDGDYDLGDVDLDSMDSAGELFPRAKPVQTWSNPMDEAALSQALSDLDVPALSPTATTFTTPSATTSATKGSSLQLAFESPEDADFIAVQIKAATQTQGKGRETLALGPQSASQPSVCSGEPVFDPTQAEDLATSLKQESESILRGAALARGASGPENTAKDENQATQLGCHGVAFVPPIKPILQADAKADLSLNSGAIASQEISAVLARDKAEPAMDAGKKDKKKRATSLAGIDLPCFPKP